MGQPAEHQTSPAWRLLVVGCATGIGSAARPRSRRPTRFLGRRPGRRLAMP